MAVKRKLNGIGARMPSTVALIESALRNGRRLRVEAFERAEIEIDFSLDVQFGETFDTFAPILADKLLDSAEEHLEATGLLLDRLPRSSQVCARASLESSAKAWWLLEAGIPDQERARRVASVLVGGYDRLRLLFKSEPIPEASALLDILAALAKQMSDALGTAPWNATDVTNRMFQSETPYRMLSSPTHSELTSLGLDLEDELQRGERWNLFAVGAYIEALDPFRSVLGMESSVEEISRLIKGDVR